eukprot:TRINITY_DN10870_c0_g1_i1.p1 TRINITY_DN10870_c0_g1~~TRINITY_DN10870_c0_g1_i1.p1  ORF type:complete len:325 (-),score=70.72 TRINITY_DN10870_c0_g1_i1:64-1038(-)
MHLIGATMTFLVTILAALLLPAAIAAGCEGKTSLYALTLTDDTTCTVVCFDYQTGLSTTIGQVAMACAAPASIVTPDLQVHFAVADAVGNTFLNAIDVKSGRVASTLGIAYAPWYLYVSMQSGNIYGIWFNGTSNLHEIFVVNRTNANHISVVAALPARLTSSQDNSAAAFNTDSGGLSFILRVPHPDCIIYSIYTIDIIGDSTQVTHLGEYQYGQPYINRLLLNYDTQRFMAVASDAKGVALGTVNMTSGAFIALSADSYFAAAGAEVTTAADITPYQQMAVTQVVSADGTFAVVAADVKTGKAVHTQTVQTPLLSLECCASF